VQILMMHYVSSRAFKLVLQLVDFILSHQKI
jgi:hypothetical protein